MESIYIDANRRIFAKGMPLNAEHLPAEYIDRIQITLNPLLYQYINVKNRNINPKKELRLWHSYKYGLRWHLDIQAQQIHPNDIYGSIAGAVFQLIEKKFLALPVENTIMDLFVHEQLGYFVSEVREIEFSFDFTPEAIRIANPNAFIYYNGTVYLLDRRVHYGRPSRKSFLKMYDRNARLKKVNKLSHKTIEKNPFSARIEFLLNKSNCPYRSLNNLIGTYQEVITRYIPYLSTLYNRLFFKKILLNPTDHPYFAQIIVLAYMGRARYTGGDLEKHITHKPSMRELQFFTLLESQKENAQSANALALQALQG